MNFLGPGHGGSVMLSRAFHSALSKSVRKHFPDSDGEKGEGGRIIHCMCHDSQILLQVRCAGRDDTVGCGGMWCGAGRGGAVMRFFFSRLCGDQPCFNLYS